jgi:hypothetical protein
VAAPRRRYKLSWSFQELNCKNKKGFKVSRFQGVEGKREKKQLSVDSRSLFYISLIWQKKKTTAIDLKLITEN